MGLDQTVCYVVNEQNIYIHIKELICNLRGFVPVLSVSNKVSTQWSESNDLM